MALSPLGRWAVVYAALAGLAAVALDAWAAHGLDGTAAGRIATAARLWMWHALAILVLAPLQARASGTARRLLAAVLAAFAAGSLLFGGGLVAATLGGSAATAPIGGSICMLGWALLGVAAMIRAGESR